MTTQECLNNELDYLKSLLCFFEKIKYEVVIGMLNDRIDVVKNKINEETKKI